MNTKVLCIECGFTSVEIVDLEYDKSHKNKTKINRIVTIPTPKGTVTQAGLVELETLAFAIKNVLTDYKIKTKDVVFTVNSELIHARKMTIPYQNTSSKILEVLKAKAEDDKVFPIDLKGNILSFVELEKITASKEEKSSESENREESEELPKQPSDVLEESSEVSEDKDIAKDGKNVENKKKEKSGGFTTNKSSKKDAISQSVMGFIAPESFVKSYLDLGNLLGLRVKSIDYAGNSLCNFLTTRNEYKYGSYLIVQITDFDCIITTIQDGVMIEQRSTEYSYDTFANPLITRNKLFDNVSTLDEAFEYITRINLFNMSEKDIDALPLNDLDKEDFSKIRDEVEDSFLSLFSRISSFINQYRVAMGRNIDRIVYVSSRSSFPDISESIRVNTGIETETLVVSQDWCEASDSQDLVVTCNKDLSVSFSGLNEFDLKTIANCLGAHINPADFNILDSEIQKNKERTNKICFGIILGVLSVCVFYGLHVAHDYLNVVTKNQKLKIDISNATQAQEIYNDYMNSDYALVSLTTFDASNKTTLNEMDAILSDIESVVPSGLVEIVSIIGTEESITLSIEAKNKYAVAHFIQGLESLKWFAKLDENDVETTGNVDVSSVVDTYTTDDTIERTVTTTIVCTFGLPTEEYNNTIENNSESESPGDVESNS